MTTAGHLASFGRYTRGKSITGNRPVYGYLVRCSCGWKQRVNGTLREAKQAHRQHRMREST